MMSLQGKSYLQYLLIHNLILCRHTKPLPEELFQRVEKELFDGDLTDEEKEEKGPYVPPYLISITNS
jgi:hypothetical protein